MADELFEMEVEPAPVEEKPKRKRGVMSGEEKQALVERLRAGKAKAKAARSGAKQTPKAEKPVVQEEKKVVSGGDGGLVDQVKALRTELRDMRDAETARRKAKAEARKAPKQEAQAAPAPGPSKVELKRQAEASASKPAQSPAPAQPPKQQYREVWCGRTNKVIRKKI